MGNRERRKNQNISNNSHPPARPYLKNKSKKSLVESLPRKLQALSSNCQKKQSETDIIRHPNRIKDLISLLFLCFWAPYTPHFLQTPRFHPPPQE
jgi:hypothetical protein